jgi:hypothetical protein
MQVPLSAQLLVQSLINQLIIVQNLHIFVVSHFNDPFKCDKGHCLSFNFDFKQGQTLLILVVSQFKKPT